MNLQTPGPRGTQSRFLQTQYNHNSMISQPHESTDSNLYLTDIKLIFLFTECGELLEVHTGIACGYQVQAVVSGWFTP